MRVINAIIKGKAVPALPLGRLCQKRPFLTVDIWRRAAQVRIPESIGSSPSLARFLPTSLAFHHEIIHAKTKLSRSSAGSPICAT